MSAFVETKDEKISVAVMVMIENIWIQNRR